MKNRSPSVFISHSSLDSAFAEALRNDLLQHRIDVWLDQADLVHGQDIERKVREAIESSNFLLVVLSHHSTRSAWAHFEVGMASVRPHPGDVPRVLPIVIDDCELPVYIQSHRYADFREPALWLVNVSALVVSIHKAHKAMRHELRVRRLKIAGAVGLVAGLAAALVLQYWQARDQQLTELAALSSRIEQQWYTHPQVAEGLARDLTARHPKVPNVWRLMGWSLWYEHKNEEALKAFDKGLQLLPDRHSVEAQQLLLGKANAWAALPGDENHRLARQQYLALIREHQHPLAFINLGNLSFRQGHHAQALREFQDAFERLVKDYRPDAVPKGLGYTSVAVAMAQARAVQPLDAGAVLAQLDRAVCFEPAVTDFLVGGRAIVGTFGYGAFSPTWKDLKARSEVQAWLKGLATRAAVPQTARCDG